MTITRWAGVPAEKGKKFPLSTSLRALTPLQGGAPTRTLSWLIASGRLSD